MVEASVRTIPLVSKSGRFAFGDPCDLDDGLGQLDDELGLFASSLKQIRFAYGGGRYRLTLRVREVGGWGRRICRIELAREDAPDEPQHRHWRDFGLIGVDTGTVAVLDPDSFGRLKGYGYDDLFGMSLLGLDPDPDFVATLPPSGDTSYVGVPSGLGDGGYVLEIDGPADAVRKARIVFIDEDEIDALGG